MRAGFAAAALLLAALPAGAARPRDARSAQLAIMEKGSLRTSRTAVIGWRTLPVPAGTRDVQATARRNFREAASLVLADPKALSLSLATAQRLNRILTQGLVADAVRGRSDHWGRDPRPLYRWLASKEARELGRRDPVALAERVHHDVSELDAFPDGNGRTARLLADLVLLRAGRAPAYYTPLADYFRRGAVRAKVSREEQLAYFREIAARGERALAARALTAH